jgi:hypothetical protein
VNLADSKNMRIHITRNTAYGDRFKLFKFEIEAQGITNLSKTLGFSLKQDDGTYLIDELMFNGEAQKQGVEFDDKLTAVEVSNPNHLHKNWGYAVGFVFLALILATQLRRRQPNASSKSH